MIQGPCGNVNGWRRGVDQNCSKTIPKSESVRTTEVNNKEKADCLSYLFAKANLSRSFLSAAAAAFSGEARKVSNVS